MKIFVNEAAGYEVEAARLHHQTIAFYRAKAEADIRMGHTPYHRWLPYATESMLRLYMQSGETLGVRIAAARTLAELGFTDVRPDLFELALEADGLDRQEAVGGLRPGCLGMNYGDAVPPPLSMEELRTLRTLSQDSESTPNAVANALGLYYDYGVEGWADTLAGAWEISPIPVAERILVLLAHSPAHWKRVLQAVSRDTYDVSTRSNALCTIVEKAEGATQQKALDLLTDEVSRAEPKRGSMPSYFGFAMATLAERAGEKQIPALVSVAERWLDGAPMGGYSIAEVLVSLCRLEPAVGLRLLHRAFSHESRVAVRAAWQVADANTGPSLARDAMAAFGERPGRQFFGSNLMGFREVIPLVLDWGGETGRTWLEDHIEGASASVLSAIIWHRGGWSAGDLARALHEAGVIPFAPAVERNEGWRSLSLIADDSGRSIYIDVKRPHPIEHELNRMAAVTGGTFAPRLGWHLPETRITLDEGIEVERQTGVDAGFIEEGRLYSLEFEDEGFVSGRTIAEAANRALAERSADERFITLDTEHYWYVDASRASDVLKRFGIALPKSEAFRDSEPPEWLREMAREALMER